MGFADPSSKQVNQFFSKWECNHRLLQSGTFHDDWQQVSIFLARCSLGSGTWTCNELDPSSWSQLRMPADYSLKPWIGVFSNLGKTRNDVSWDINESIFLKLFSHSSHRPIHPDSLLSVGIHGQQTCLWWKSQWLYPPLYHGSSWRISGPWRTGPKLILNFPQFQDHRLHTCNSMILNGFDQENSLNYLNLRDFRT